MESCRTESLKERPNAATIRAGSRIHISLADLGLASRRTYGGVGFMVDRPAAVIEVRRSAETQIEGMTRLDDLARQEIGALVKDLAHYREISAKVSIIEHAPQHVGLGSKTAIKLSLIAGFNQLFELGLTREQQQLMSGRGGTSGIGIHGFYEGGVIWDAGRSHEEVRELLPSSAVTGATALFMMRMPFPQEWKVGLALTGGPVIHGAEEVRFVRDQTPVDERDALKTMCELYHGVLPSFRCGDLTALADALADLSSHGFKRAEIERCGEGANALMKELQRAGHACGISSVGPILYTIIAKEDDAGARAVMDICTSYGSDWLGFFDGLNSPAKLVLE